MEREKNIGSRNQAKQRIIVFFKTPTVGRVKTRVAQEFDEHFACDLYTAMLEDLSRNLKPLYEQMAWYCTEAVSVGLEHITGKNVYIQRGADLGSRIYNALLDEFKAGIEKAILMGSDIPHIDYVILTEYLKKLDTHDAVIGPSEDGGYYLIGFKRHALTQTVFKGIPWSTADVYGKTIENIHACGLKLHEGPLLQDIDTVEDLRNVLSTEQNKIPAVKRVFENYRRKYGSL